MVVHRLRSVLAGGLVLSGLVFAALTGFGLNAAPPANGNNNNRVDVLIGFRNTPGAAERNLVRGHGGTVRRSFTIVPAVAATLPEKAVEALQRDNRVTVIEPDGEFHAIDHKATQGDAELNNTWGVKHIGAGRAHLGDGPFAATVGLGVRVAIIDSGVDHTHPEFQGLFGSVLGKDFVNGDDDPMDDNGHGTHVAGTVAALKGNGGVVGVAPDVQLFALKVLAANGSGSFSNVIAAVQWCVDNEVHVTNNSYGSSMNPGSIVQAAFDNAYAAGVLHVAAAGNAGNPRGTGNNVGYPARYDSVVAVAATDQNDKRASFSSTGPAVEISAPGVGINSTLPGGGYGTASGTSMASPHVAGVAALAIAAGVYGPDNVRDVLTVTATDLGAAGRDSHFGYGLVYAPDAVELAEALADGTTPPPPPPSEEPPPTSTEMTVKSIEYRTSGGKNNNKDLIIELSVVQVGSEQGVDGADISISLHRDGSLIASGSGKTGNDGTVTFRLNNARSGTYSTTVDAVSRDGFTWDGETPENSFTK